MYSFVHLGTANAHKKSRSCARTLCSCSVLRYELTWGGGICICICICIGIGIGIGIGGRSIITGGGGGGCIGAGAA